MHDSFLSFFRTTSPFPRLLHTTQLKNESSMTFLPVLILVKLCKNFSSKLCCVTKKGRTCGLEEQQNFFMIVKSIFGKKSSNNNNTLQYNENNYMYHRFVVLTKILVCPGLGRSQASTTMMDCDPST